MLVAECSSSHHCIAELMHRTPLQASRHTSSSFPLCRRAQRLRNYTFITCQSNRRTAGPTSEGKQHTRDRKEAGQEYGILITRRNALLAGLVSGSLLAAQGAEAFQAPPPGFRLQRDKLDGYSFLLPESWTPLSSSGNDIFFRNPYNVNENLFVNISSPSSSRYTSVEDLRSPEAAAEQTLRQYLEELMSTRLGVKRTGNVVSASERRAPDGKLYYDLELEAKSYASRNQLAVSQKQIDAAMELEWERRYITVLGVANKRLYEFRLQTAKDTYDTAKDTLLGIAQSFRCTDLEA